MAEKYVGNCGVKSPYLIGFIGAPCHSRPRYPKWAAFLAEHPGSWSKLTQCPTESVYKVGVEDSDDFFFGFFGGFI